MLTIWAINQRGQTARGLVYAATLRERVNKCVSELPELEAMVRESG